MMTVQESRAWRPEIQGWSDDILPFYDEIAHELVDGDSFCELGVASGRSAIFLASKLLELRKSNVKIYCVDLWPGSEFAERFASTIQRGLASTEEIAMLYPIRATTERASHFFKRGELAGIFVDDDHSFEGCLVTIQAFVGSARVRHGGIIAGHDFNETDFPGVVQAVNRFFGGRVQRHGHSVWRVAPPTIALDDGAEVIPLTQKNPLEVA